MNSNRESGDKSLFVMAASAQRMLTNRSIGQFAKTRGVRPPSQPLLLCLLPGSINELEPGLATEPTTEHRPLATAHRPL